MVVVVDLSSRLLACSWKEKKKKEEERRVTGGIGR